MGIEVEGLMTAAQLAAEGLESLCLGQAVGGRDSHGGPDHHNVEAIRSGAHMPRLARSAGLSEERTCLQSLGGTRD